MAMLPRHDMLLFQVLAMFTARPSTPSMPMSADARPVFTDASISAELRLRYLTPTEQRLSLTRPHFSPRIWSRRATDDFHYFAPTMFMAIRGHFDARRRRAMTPSTIAHVTSLRSRRYAFSARRPAAFKERLDRPRQAKHASATPGTPAGARAASPKFPHLAARTAEGRWITPPRLGCQ